MGERRRLCHPARAEPRDVDVRAPGDLRGHLGGFDTGAHVTVERPVALLRARVAPRDHEHLQPVGDGVLDEAPAGSEVKEVVLVDLWWDDERRPRVDLWSRRRVLQQLAHVAAVHDRAGRDRHRPANLERSRVNLARQPVVVAHIPREVSYAGDERSSSRVDRSPQRDRVRQQAVRWCCCLRHLHQCEPCSVRALVVEVEVVDAVEHDLACGQVRLRQSRPTQGRATPGRQIACPSHQAPTLASRRALRSATASASRLLSRPRSGVAPRVPPTGPMQPRPVRG